MKEVLDFLNSIEGAGYGGMASFEIARSTVKDAVSRCEVQTDVLRLIASAKYANPDAQDQHDWNAACEHIEDGVRSLGAAQPLQSRDETLRGLAEFFSESVHHVWDNHEIADCLTNMIGQGSELPSAQQDTLEETAQRLVNELTSQHIPRDKFFIGIGDAELHAYVQLPKVDCRADRIGGWPVVWHFNVGPAEAYALPSTPRETPHE